MTLRKTMYHNPVLLEESLEGLQVRRGGTYVDFTFGGGGHSAGILERLGKGRLIAFDQDPDAVKNRPPDKRLLLVRGNFRYVKNYLRFHGIEQIDGALADLGVSSHHFDVAERGFSFRFESKLDMRMNPQAEKTAADILNRYEEHDLKVLFASLGELRNTACLSRAILSGRAVSPLETSGQLLEAIEDCIPAKNRQKYLAKVFQALRIEVNDELGALREMLQDVTGFLTSGARLAVITYHSLEDRIVKHFFRSGKISGEAEKDFYGNSLSPFRLVNRTVITPGDDEITSNPRARSAKLRIAEKINLNGRE
jgi:16S rRNA (cytosine1402-N4)-methyltransferase